MLMDALNIKYTIVPAEIDERTIRDADYSIRAEKIARKKAEKVAKSHDGIIISGDSFAIINGREFEKPASIEEAKEMLLAESGASGIVYAGLCYLDKENNINVSKTVTIDFTFRSLTEEEIDIYIQKFPVLTWSGAISPAYIYGMTMIEKINGSLTGFAHGFPIEEIIKLLKQSGVSIHP
jgi:septum formation protein